MKTIFLISIYFLFCAGLLCGQIVNIEAKRGKLEADTTGWFGSGDLGFDLSENGKTVFTTTANLNVEYQGEKDLWLSFTNFRLVRVESEDFVNTGYQHLRYNRQLTEKITWEAFAQLQYDRRLKLTPRFLAGTGPRFQITNSEAGMLFLGVLYMYQYEEIDEGLIIHRDNRLSNYLSYRWEVSDNSRLTGTVYYQPLLSDFSTTRLSAQTTFLIDINEKLSFKTAFNLVYDRRLSDDVSDVPNAVYNLVTGLKFRFR